MLEECKRAVKVKTALNQSKSTKFWKLSNYTMDLVTIYIFWLGNIVFIFISHQEYKKLKIADLFFLHITSPRISLKSCFGEKPVFLQNECFSNLERETFRGLQIPTYEVKRQLVTV
jgi:hypothetical protein